ncbi:calcium:proton antiporter [Pedobacter faecalis]|uniref:calcium:proton antiporter n=1 Tax=Pedobacter faecalis TaxID=3041495 RepID=UPI00254D28A0|nr:ionic transporter y4hA [Pedobacter sp. ELA7]
MRKILSLPLWTIIAPLLALAFLILNVENTMLAVLAAAGLVAAVMSAVHHAEVIAHKVGEPFGTLILALAITVIEVSLIVSLMFAGGEEAVTLARDTVFAAVMIIITGIIGMCLLLGGLYHKEQKFGMHAVSAALVGLVAICTLTLILPNYTTSILGPSYSKSQLIFVSVISLVLYGTFVLIQTVRHRDYFLPASGADDEEQHAAPPTAKTAILSLVLLLGCLVAVVMLAKKLAPIIETGVVSLGAPKAVVGIIVALVILLPEGIAAVRAAAKNRLQTSLNLALGSALASIGLTIPAVAIASLITGINVTLGIDAKSIVLLTLSFITVMISFQSGKTTIMQGVVLLVLFFVYLFLTIFP